MKTLLANPEYSFYNASGNENRDVNGELRWKSIVDLLSAVIADVEQPAEERDRAAEVLKFYAAKEKEAEGKAEIDRTVVGMLARGDAHCLWEWPDSFVVETVTGQDGITHQNVVNKRREETPAPMPAPVPTFEPAVPLPVLAPSAEEQKAVRDMSFDERFSPAAVAARVAANEREAAQMRASRGQTE